MQTRKFAVDKIRAEVNKARTAYDEAVAAVNEYNDSLTSRLQDELTKAFDLTANAFTDARGEERKFLSSNVQGRLNEVAGAYPTVSTLVSADWVDNWERKLDALEGDTIDLADHEWDTLRSSVDNTVNQAESTKRSVSA